MSALKSHRGRPIPHELQHLEQMILTAFVRHHLVPTVSIDGTFVQVLHFVYDAIGASRRDAHKAARRLLRAHLNRGPNS